MAGTMMNTRSRVKRTVMDIPKRLTTRLSKGSRRNMVKGPGKAGALQPDTRAARSAHPVPLLVSNSLTPTPSPQPAPRPHSKVHILLGLCERRNATGAGGNGKASKGSARSAGEFRQRRLSSSENREHAHQFHGHCRDTTVGADVLLRRRGASPAVREQLGKEPAAEFPCGC